MGTRTTSVMELLNRIRTDDQLVLPDIQREFVWREEQIRLLMDSLMRGYPFGALLVWQTQFVAVPFRPFVRDFQPGMTFVTSEKPAKQKMEMVLDGQQRLQSLYLAAFGSYAGRHLYFNITSGSDGAADDADSEGARFRFEFWRMDETNRPKRLLRVADIIAWPGHKEDARIDDAIERVGLEDAEASTARNNLRTLRRVFTQTDLVPVETIDEHAYDARDARTIDEVVEIFVRVNSGGTKLSRSDLMFSLLKAKWEGARRSFDDLVTAADPDGALGIDKDFVIRGLLTVADKPPSYDVDNIRRHGDAMQAVFETFGGALKAAVDFARDEGLVSASLLTPRSTLFPVIYYLAFQNRHSVPDADRRPLRAFLYLLLFNRFLSDGRPDARIRYLRAHLATAKGASLPLDDLLKVIEARQKWHYTSTSVEMLNANQRLALNIAQPRVARPTLTWQSKAEVDHIFPQSKYREGHPQLVDDIGNFAYLGKLRNIRKSDEEPGEYFKSIPDDELADSYLIEDRKLLAPDRFEDFVMARRARILSKVKSFLDR